MIAAKYKLFSAEPKLVSSRDTRTEEAGRTRHFNLVAAR